MTNITIRMATASENQEKLLHLTEFQEVVEENFSHHWGIDSGRMAIECDEGVFFIWSEVMWFTWYDSLEEMETAIQEELNIWGMGRNYVIED